MSSGVSECSCRRINWKCSKVIQLLDEHLLFDRSKEETLKLLQEHTSVRCSNSVFRKHVATRRRELRLHGPLNCVQSVPNMVVMENSKKVMRSLNENVSPISKTFNAAADIDETVQTYWKLRCFEQNKMFLGTTTRSTDQSKEHSTVISTVTSRGYHSHSKINDGASSSNASVKLVSKPSEVSSNPFKLDESVRIKLFEIIRKNAQSIEAPPNMPLVKNLLDHLRSS